MTGERVHSIKMNCFIKKTENNISEEDAPYSERSVTKCYGCVKQGSGHLCSLNSRRARRI